MSSLSSPERGANRAAIFVEQLARRQAMADRRGDRRAASDELLEALREVSGVPDGVGLAQGDASPRAERRAAAALQRASYTPLAPPPAQQPPRRRRRRRRDPEPARPRRSQSRRARNARRLHAALKAYGAELAERSASWELGDQLPQVKAGYRRVRRDVWIKAADLISDTTGKAWRYHAAMHRNKSALGAIRRAALVPCEEGATRRTWRSETARNIAALGIVLLELAAPTLRKGPWRSIVRGIPVELLRWMLRAPGAGPEDRPSKSALIGQHRGPQSAHGCGQLGYLRELERAGLISSQSQYPDPEIWEQSAPCERAKRYGLERWRMNRYWVCGDPGLTVDPIRRAQLIQLNREGWASLAEIPTRAPRRALPLGWLDAPSDPDDPPD